MQSFIFIYLIIDKILVFYLTANRFTSFSHNQKIEIKQLCRPTPDLKGLINKVKTSKNEYIRLFNTNYYVKYKGYVAMI